MKKDSTKSLIEELLQFADVAINGKNPWDIQIHNEKLYDRVLRDQDLGLGETYMEGWWDCPQIDLFIERLANADIESKLKKNPRFVLKLLLAKTLNFQTKARSLKVGRTHYDLGNDLYRTMLDTNMNYTCGYWKNADNLDDAQIAKLDLSCRKLKLEPGMRVLDIGCGWGAFAKYAATNYGVSVVGITISQQQYELAQENCKNLPIEIRFQDYRDVDEKFDRIASLGMFEHVGHLNYRQYMKIVHRSLAADDGLFLLHTIGGNESTTHAAPWITKYIFPNGMLPSIMQIGKASEKLLVMEDWHNFGVDYDKTLMAWHQNFNDGWESLKANYDEQFFRMWNYYLLYCAAGFRARVNQLWQIVFSKKGVQGGYDPVR